MTEEERVFKRNCLTSVRSLPRKISLKLDKDKHFFIVVLSQHVPYLHLIFLLSVQHIYVSQPMLAGGGGGGGGGGVVYYSDEKNFCRGWDLCGY
jgi:hypothetical protein